MPAQKPAQLTVRGLDPSLLAAIRAEARRRGVSLNAATLALLREALGLATRKAAPAGNGLDRFAGCWSAAQAAEFGATLAEQRRIDPDMWK